MLYILHGDPNKTFSKAQEMVDSMISKKPDAVVLNLNEENFSGGKLEELIESQSLFTQKYIVKVSRPSTSVEFFETIQAKIKEIKNSENIFIIADPDIKKIDLKKLEKHAEKVQEFKKTETKKEKHNVFAITDALGERDAKKLWLLYNDLSKKVRVEELHGILWWQIKSMNLAAKCKSAEEAGLKTFVYSKAKKFAGNYSEKELENLTNNMIKVLHDSRTTGPSLDIGLERLILGL